MRSFLYVQRVELNLSKPFMERNESMYKPPEEVVNDIMRLYGYLEDIESAGSLLNKDNHKSCLEFIEMALNRAKMRHTVIVIRDGNSESIESNIVYMAIQMKEKYRMDAEKYKNLYEEQDMESAKHVWNWVFANGLEFATLEDFINPEEWEGQCRLCPYTIGTLQKAWRLKSKIVHIGLI
jgi:hypothetical protein